MTDRKEGAMGETQAGYMTFTERPSATGKSKNTPTPRPFSPSMGGVPMAEDRTPGRRLWDRIEGSQVSSGSGYFTMANPAVKAAYERVGGEIEARISELESELDEQADVVNRLGAAKDNAEPALADCERERYEAKGIIANFTGILEADPRYVAMKSKAEAAESALAATREALQRITEIGKVLDSVRMACPEQIKFARRLARQALVAEESDSDALENERNASAEDS